MSFSVALAIPHRSKAFVPTPGSSFSPTESGLVARLVAHGTPTSVALAGTARPAGGAVRSSEFVISLAAKEQNFGH